MTATAILDLEKAGFTREQVEALAHWHDAMIDVRRLGTKSDLEELRLATKADMAELKADLIRWFSGMMLASGLIQIGAVLGGVFALLKLFPGGHP